MLPIVLDQTAVSVGVAGAGEALERRRAMLAESDVGPISVSADAQSLGGVNILFVAGISKLQSQRLAKLARGQGILVNVEDMPELCDFHVPAQVRRGDLLLTVSTAGTSPGLAKLIREWLERRLGAEWSVRLKEVSQARASWRAQGDSPSDVARRTRDFVRAREWLS